MAKVWLPDYPPASPSAYDDEFDDASLAVEWTEWDVPDDTTVSEEAYGLSLVKATSANTYFSGLFKTAPNNDWTIWAKFSMLLNRGSNMAILGGLLLGEDLVNNPSTSDVIVMRFGYNYWLSGDMVDAQKFASYQGDGAVGYGSVISDGVIGAHIYQRIRRASNTLYFDFSTNGIGWQNVGSTAEPFIPAQFGVALMNLAGGISVRQVCSFFRYAAGTSTFSDVMNGQRVL